MELHLHSLICLHGVHKDNFIFTCAVYCSDYRSIKQNNRAISKALFVNNLEISGYGPTGRMNTVLVFCLQGQSKILNISVMSVSVLLHIHVPFCIGSTSLAKEPLTSKRPTPVWMQLSRVLQEKPIIIKSSSHKYNQSRPIKKEGWFRPRCENMDNGTSSTIMYPALELY